MITPILSGVALAATQDPSLAPDAPGAVPPIAFVVTALFTVAVILLGLDLVRRLRRSQFKSEIRTNLEAELAERDARAGGDASVGEAGGAAGGAVSGEAASEAGSARPEDPEAGSGPAGASGAGDDAKG
ncbi:MAG: hypothetical protein KDB25_10240 [Leucobacter sp.]|nr:hypothetical protein [Leucobacter sp.]